LNKAADTLRHRVHGVGSLRIFLRRFVVALVIAVVVTSTGMVAASVLEEHKLSAIHRIDLPDDTLEASKPGAPANFLIIGSDTRSFVDSEGQTNAFGKKDDSARSDVMMVVHVVPSLGSVYVVSFPRDTYVEIPGHGKQLLNAAFEIGGPALTIQTFKEDFGIPIQHYLAVNFVGFEKIVNAIGHVKIYFPTPARDFFSQLDEPVAGCHSLNGTEALAYARSRHYAIPAHGVTDPDPQDHNDWNEDPLADLDRIQRQQYFLRSLSQTAIDRGASNPITAFKLAGAVVSSLTGDKTLSNGDIKRLVNSFVGLDPATVEMTTLPVTGGYNGAPLTAQYPEAQPVLDRLKNLADPLSLPPIVAPSTIKVVVVDASGVEGRAKAVNDAFVAHGFKSGGYGDATSSDYEKTQVRYAAGQANKGFTTAFYAGALSSVVQTTDASVRLGSKTLHGDVLVVLGRDYPKLEGLLSKPVPSTTTTIASASTTTTTTTPPVTADTRYVPVSATGLEPLVGCP
jgi:LCP family protein required for cell wall assembly